MATLFIADLHLQTEEPAITAGFLRFLRGEAKSADALYILGHHYQTDEVIRHADATGDSLKLSQIAARIAGM